MWVQLGGILPLGGRPGQRIGDKEVVAEFNFKNVGTTPVTIRDLTTSCECTAAELAKRTYAPGEAGTVKAVFTPGDHGSTFGGNPVAGAAACAVVDEITEELLANVTAQGAKLRTALAQFAGVTEVRGAGLLIGAETVRPAASLVTQCYKEGLIVLTAGANTVRLAPPLVVGEAEVDRALTILEEVLS